jgi:hypothetical protein
MTTARNFEPCASVDAPIASQFHSWLFWRRATEHNRSATPCMSRFLLFLMLALVFTSCRTPVADQAGPDVDLRQGSDHCELHSVQMCTARVPAAIGSVLPYAGYLEARDKLFPHSFPRVLESKKRYCLIYVCDECIAAERQWSQTHEPELNKALHATAATPGS